LQPCDGQWGFLKQLLKGVVVGQGETCEAALADVKSAIQFHVETFEKEAVELDPPILEAFIAEARVSV
jgi:predicted RNase H-like HicB family nuclease